MLLFTFLERGIYPRVILVIRLGVIMYNAIEEVFVSSLVAVVTARVEVIIVDRARGGVTGETS
jgi:hypothetical protein